MITSHIGFNGAQPTDAYETWGLIYLDADERHEAPTKPLKATSYAEEAGEHIDPRSVQDAFDYRVTFAITGDGKNSVEAVNHKINAFNQAMYDVDPITQIRTYKEITFFNELNDVVIVGYPNPIEEAKEMYRGEQGEYDCAVVELVIRVADPRKCMWESDFVGLLTEDNGGLLLENGGLLLTEITL